MKGTIPRVPHQFPYDSYHSITGIRKGASHNATNLQELRPGIVKGLLNTSLSIKSSQNIMFHQPRYNKGISLTKPQFGVRSSEVAIILRK